VEWVLAMLAVLVFLSGIAVAATLLVVRAVRRVVTPAVERAGLTLWARAPGPSGDLARLRRDLDDAVRRGRRAVGVAHAVGAPVGEVPELLRRIEAAAADLAAELRAISVVADPARRAALLAAPKRRVGDLVGAADDLAEAMAHAAADAGSDVGELRAACAVEAEALREGARVRASWGRLAG
jgi:hypothetical protein